MRKVYIAVLLVFMVGLLVPPLQVRGSDAWLHRVLRVPYDYPTIQEAVNNARSGDIILVYPGTYNEQVSIKYKHNIIIRAVGDVLLDGTNSKKHAFYIYRSSNITIDGFEMTRYTRNTIEIRWTDYVTVQNVYIHDSTGIYIDVYDYYPSSHAKFYFINVTVVRSNKLYDRWGSSLPASMLEFGDFVYNVYYIIGCYIDGFVFFSIATSGGNRYYVIGSYISHLGIDPSEIFYGGLWTSLSYIKKISANGGQIYPEDSSATYMVYGNWYSGTVGSRWGEWSGNLEDRNYDGVGDHKVRVNLGSGFYFYENKPFAPRSLYNFYFIDSDHVLANNTNGDNDVFDFVPGGSHKIQVWIDVPFVWNNYHSVSKVLALPSTVYMYEKGDFRIASSSTATVSVSSASTKTLTISLSSPGTVSVFYPSNYIIDSVTMEDTIGDATWRTWEVSDGWVFWGGLARKFTIVFKERTEVNVVAEVIGTGFAGDKHIIQWHTYGSSDVTGGIAVYVNGNSIADNEPLNGSISWTPIAPGTYNITVVLETSDPVVGNLSDTIILDVTYRWINIDLEVEGENYASEPQTISWTTTSNDDNLEDYAYVNLYVNETLLGSKPLNGSISWTPPSSGTFVFKAVVVTDRSFVGTGEDTYIKTLEKNPTTISIDSSSTEWVNSTHINVSITGTVIDVYGRPVPGTLYVYTVKDEVSSLVETIMVQNDGVFEINGVYDPDYLLLDFTPSDTARYTVSSKNISLPYLPKIYVDISVSPHTAYALEPITITWSATGDIDPGDRILIYIDNRLIRNTSDMSGALTVTLTAGDHVIRAVYSTGRVIGGAPEDSDSVEILLRPTEVQVSYDYTWINTTNVNITLTATGIDMLTSGPVTGTITIYVNDTAYMSLPSPITGLVLDVRNPAYLKLVFTPANTSVYTDADTVIIIEKPPVVTIVVYVNGTGTALEPVAISYCVESTKPITGTVEILINGTLIASGLPLSATVKWTPPSAGTYIGYVVLDTNQTILGEKEKEFTILSPRKSSHVYGVSKGETNNTTIMGTVYVNITNEAGYSSDTILNLYVNRTTEDDQVPGYIDTITVIIKSRNDIRTIRITTNTGGSYSLGILPSGDYDGELIIRYRAPEGYRNLTVRFALHVDPRPLYYNATMIYYPDFNKTLVKLDLLDMVTNTSSLRVPVNITICLGDGYMTSIITDKSVELIVNGAPMNPRIIVSDTMRVYPNLTIVPKLEYDPVNPVLEIPSNIYALEPFNITASTTLKTLPYNLTVYLDGRIIYVSTKNITGTVQIPLLVGEHNVTLVISTALGNVTVTRMLRTEPRPVELSADLVRYRWLNKTHVLVVLNITVIDRLSGDLAKGLINIAAYKDESAGTSIVIRYPENRNYTGVLDPVMIAVSFRNSTVYQSVSTALKVPVPSSSAGASLGGEILYEPAVLLLAGLILAIIFVSVITVRRRF